MAELRHLPEFAHSLFRVFDAEGIPLLLAGGWAVCFHGRSRATLDIDWICRRSQSVPAHGLMERLGFRAVSDGMASRFKNDRDPSIPFTDLIWVDDETFATMQEGATNSPHPLPVAMIGLRALLAMKLFALKDGEARDHKDLLDIRSLLRYSLEQIPDDEFRLMCNRYAGVGAYERIKSGA